MSEISETEWLPKRVARVIPADIDARTLGSPNVLDVFVTDAEAIREINARQIAAGLAIPMSASGFQVIEFPTPNGIASPINRMLPDFVGYGRTAGGLPEYVISNGPIPRDAKIRRV